MQSFLAMIIPVSGGGGPVDPGYSPPWAQVPGGGGPPPSIWPGPHPSHPIMLPGMPGWGSGGGGGGQPPLGMWGPNDPRPSNPIYWPGFPGGGGGGGGGQPPLGMWGPNDPRPTNPIAGMGPGGNFPQPKPPGLPGQLPAQDPSGSGWVYAFVPGYGWMWCQVPQPPTSGTQPPDSGVGPAHPIQPTVPEPKEGA